MRYPEHLLKLISVLKKLPGVGNKSAERFAFHMLDWPEDKLLEMSSVIGTVKANLKNCLECGALMGAQNDVCPFCDTSKRNLEVLCVVASAKDLFLVEETREYRGLYHVLGGLLSPFNEKFNSLTSIEKLKKRISQHQVKEVILAFDSTLEGDGTALFLKKELSYLRVNLTRLAFGLPMGSSFEFIDGGTLGKALAGRQTL